MNFFLIKVYIGLRWMTALAQKLNAHWPDLLFDVQYISLLVLLLQLLIWSFCSDYHTLLYLCGNRG